MRHDSKSVSLITQHHMYLSFLAINFCLSSRNMTAVPCTGIFATLNLSRVGWWRDETFIPLSETKQAREINPKLPWWLTWHSLVNKYCRRAGGSKLQPLLSFWNLDTLQLPNSKKIDCSYVVICTFPLTHTLYSCSILQYLSMGAGDFLSFQDFIFEVNKLGVRGDCHLERITYPQVYSFASILHRQQPQDIQTPKIKLYIYNFI